MKHDQANTVTLNAITKAVKAADAANNAKCGPAVAPCAGDFDLISVPSVDALAAGFADNPEAAPKVFAPLPVVAGEDDDGLLLPPAASVEAHYLKNLLQNGADAMVMPIQAARSLADLGWCDFQPLPDLTGADSEHVVAMLNLQALEDINPDFGVYDQNVFGLLLTESETFSAWVVAVEGAAYEVRGTFDDEEFVDAIDARNEQASAAAFGTVAHGLEGGEALRVELAVLQDLVCTVINELVGLQITIESLGAYQEGVKAGLVRPTYQDGDAANDAQAVIRCGAEG